jgi:histidinol-phosphate aminotransferase
MSVYQKPPERYDGLRLHQSENTGGCSPRVLEALAALRADQIAFYPPYAAAVEACARYFDVLPEQVALTNGLDEGIMAASIVFLRPSPGKPQPEAVVPEPAFEIYRYDTAVAGGRLVQVMPRPDFTLPLDDVLAAITPVTRVVFLTNPNNPTGVPIAANAISAVAQRVPEGAVVFVDEAYVDFSGETFLPRLASCPNVIVGRTFSKSYGLAGLRIGCLIGAPETIRSLRPAIPTYSVNIAAVVALQAALRDPEWLRAYLRQVAESRELMYAACDRLGIMYWKSSANFVLINAGNRSSALVSGAAERGVFIRDRSTEPGCAGCIRISTGIVAHTKRCIAVMEEVLCAAR